MGHGLLQHITFVRHLGGHALALRFEDGVEGTVNLREIVREFTGPLAPLQDPAFVARVYINERGTITWPGELDLDPVVLYCAVKGIPVPAYDEPRARKARRPSSTERRTGRGRVQVRAGKRKDTRRNQPSGRHSARRRST